MRHAGDLALALACVSGNEAAWAEFHDRFRPTVERFARRLTHNPTEARDLADSLWGDLYGVAAELRSRKSPLEGFSGRSARIFNAIDVAEVEHERFERAYWRKLHGEDPPTISPLPGFYRQTRAAYGVLADAGGGTAISLRRSADINQQMLILLFGNRFAPEIAPLTGRADERAWRRAG